MYEEYKVNRDTVFTFIEFKLVMEKIFDII